MRNIFLAVVAATSLLGCVGGIDNSTPTTPPTDGVGGGGTGPAAQAAKAAFDSDVYPIIQTKCAACHSSAGPSGNVTGFVSPQASDAYTTAASYQAIVGDRTATGAPILTKLDLGHQNITYTADEKTKITNWLAKELEARAGGGTDDGGTTGGESPAAATIRLTKEWSGCMTLTNFQTANMKQWGNMRADDSACKTCHVNGEYGQIAADTDEPFFTTISTNKYYMAQYFTVDLSAGVAAAKVIINTRSFIGVGTALAPHIEHPRFKLEGSTGYQALQKFYDLTVANKAAGTCGPSTLQ